MKATLHRRLTHCPLFAGLSDLAFLERCVGLSVQQLAPGGRLDWKGGGYVAIVAEGAVASSGSVYGPGTVLGLETAILNGPRAAVVARQTTTMALLRGDLLTRYCGECCAEHRRLAENTRLLLAEHAAALWQRQRYLLIHGTRARLWAYLQEQRRRAGTDMFILDKNRRVLAEYLNLSRPSLSRELCALRDEGKLEFYKETIKLRGDA